MVAGRRSRPRRSTDGHGRDADWRTRVTDDRRDDDDQADDDDAGAPARPLFVLVRCRSCLQSRQRGVASTYAVFDTPAICAGS